MNTPHDDYTNCLEHDAVAASGAHFDMQRVQLSIAMSLKRIADNLSLVTDEGQNGYFPAAINIRKS